MNLNEHRSHNLEAEDDRIEAYEDRKSKGESNLFVKIFARLPGDGDRYRLGVQHEQR